MRVTAIVVARGGSKRLPRKALLPFGTPGSTLIGHKVETLRQCAHIDEVVVGSDSDAILEDAHKHGASIRKRDDYHCDESQCSANEMIRNMVAMIETDVVVWAHPTNPLVKSATYDAAVDAFVNRGEGFDSLFSARVVRRHAWMRNDGNRNWHPHNFDPWCRRHPLASELPPVYYQDGAIFIQPHQQMLDNAYFYGSWPLPFEVDPVEGWDIDTEQDYRAALALQGVS